MNAPQVIPSALGREVTAAAVPAVARGFVDPNASVSESTLLARKLIADIAIVDIKSPDPGAWLRSTVRFINSLPVSLDAHIPERGAP